VTPGNLAEAVRYSLLAPGKRIRPRLAIACGRMLELSSEAALRAALAVEMVHCFTLIHDDLPCMDDDDFRRGRPSNHKIHGEALALLAGDALMAMATDTLLEAEAWVPAPRVLQGLRRLSRAMGPRGVLGGQAAESLLTDQSTLEDLRAMHAGKTGALFQASLLVPKDLAGVPSDSAGGRALDTFASELGLAFQALDDLDDAAEESATPTSALYYLSESEIRSQSVAALNRSIRDLKEAWGEEPSSALVQVAQEVSGKLLATSGGPA
jgi:geranylgeranyl pyrophosphate synthase